MTATANGRLYAPPRWLIDQSDQEPVHERRTRPAPAPAPDPVTIETRDNAIIARVNLKLFDDKNVKAMNELIEQAAGQPGVIVVVLDMSRVQNHAQPRDRRAGYAFV